MEQSTNFFYGNLNTDDENRLVPQGDYRSAFYARNNEAGQSNKGGKESMSGDAIKPNEELDETQRVIGSAKWIERSSIVYFVFSGTPDVTPHSIWYYNTIEETHTLILQDNILNFKFSSKIVHAKVINNILYWTDGYFGSYLEDASGNLDFNPPRMLNIDKAIAGYAVIDFALLDFIKAPQAKAPSIELATNGGQSNFLYGKLPQFNVQWIYENGEESVWSTVSKIVVPSEWNFVQGRNYLTPNEQNRVEIAVETGSEIVKGFRVGVRNSNIDDFEVIKDVDKVIDGIDNNDIVIINYDGNVAGDVVPLSQGLRGFDRVPQVAKCFEVLPTSEACFANIREGYEGVDLGSSSAGYQTTEIPYQVYGTDARINYTTGTAPMPVLNLSTLPTTQFNFVAGDTFVFEFRDVDSATLELGSPYTVSYTVTGDDIQGTQGLTVLEKRQFLINRIGLFLFDFFVDRFGVGNVTFASATGVSPVFVISFLADYLQFPTNKTTSLLTLSSPEKMLKTGIIHEFGIEYYDRAMRSGGVLTNDNFKVFVPFATDEPSRADFLSPNSPYFVRPTMFLKHTPPDWARYYQPVYKRTLIADFQQRTGTELTLVPSLGLVKISLDSQYENQYGARINHTIQVGDTVRIVRAKGEDVEAGVTGEAPYAFEYVETTVERYEEGGGLGGAEAIYVTQFDYNTVINATNSFVLEIYSIREETTENIYYSIAEVYDVLNPYTEERVHGGQTFTGQVITSPIAGGTTFVVEGDARAVVTNEQFFITFTPSVGTPFVTTVSAVTYNYALNQSTIVVDTPSDGTTYLTYSFITELSGSASLILGFGDVYLRPRATNNREVGNGFWRYWVEDPHQSDYFVSNFIDIGKPAIINRNIFKQNLTASGLHGGRFVDNTAQNNFNSFDFNPLNKFDLDESFGSINRIIMNGYTLKVLQDRKETSIYIQRTVAVGADGSNNVSYTDRTFGGINPYESLYGTIHPASVQVIEGTMFYYDYYSSKFIRSITNGQQELSQGKYKVNAFTTNLTNQIRNSDNDYEVLGLIDEQNREYQCFFRELAEEDNYERGIIFSLDNDGWITFLDHAPIWGDNLGNVAVVFNEGQLYVCNEGENLNFLGVDRTFSVTSILNDNPNYTKTPLSSIVRCFPSPIGVNINIPAFASYTAMQTTIIPELIQTRENGFFYEFPRDENDPRFTGQVELARINGRQLRGYFIIQDIRYEGSDKFVVFSHSMNYIFSPSTI
jgi:hypothetical protein